jgi:hypothetical protein
MNAAHFRRRKKNVLGFFFYKKILHGALVFKLQLIVGSSDDIGETLRFKGANNCRTDKSVVTGDVYFSGRLRCI